MANKLLACIFFNSRSTILCCRGLVYKHHLTQHPLSDNPILSKKTAQNWHLWLRQHDSKQPAPIPRLWGHSSSGSQIGVQGQWLITAKRDRNKMFSLLNGENLTEDIRSAISLKWVYILLDTSLEFSSVLGDFFFFLAITKVYLTKKFSKKMCTTQFFW